MKPKLAAILVVGILSLSIVVAAVAAVSQALAEEPGASSIALGSYPSQTGDTEDQGGLAGTFFRVCPFH
ncbi:MAG: hypothetical protein O3A93_06460 [Chloroflexi bacterium]|nr:hypothetical protein [Chloroflexota bacterium]MDA1270884.1 hypothetical protein [Chloroflexota bacterium]